MEPTNPQIDKRAAYREHQANQSRVRKANDWLLDDADVAATKDSDNAGAHFARARSARAENRREIDTAYAVKSGATMASLASKGKDIEVSGDALRRAKAGQKPKVIVQLPDQK